MDREDVITCLNQGLKDLVIEAYCEEKGKDPELTKQFLWFCKVYGINLLPTILKEFEINILSSPIGQIIKFY